MNFDLMEIMRLAAPVVIGIAVAKSRTCFRTRRTSKWSPCSRSDARNATPRDLKRDK